MKKINIRVKRFRLSRAAFSNSMATSVSPIWNQTFFPGNFPTAISPLFAILDVGAVFRGVLMTHHYLGCGLEGKMVPLRRI